MSVSRRVVISVAVLMVLAFGSLGYQMWVVARMQRTNEELSKVNFKAAKKLLEMGPFIYDIRKGTERHFGIELPENRVGIDKALNNVNQKFDEHLRELEQVLSPWEASEEIALLSTAWIEYRSQIAGALQSQIPGAQNPPLALLAAIDKISLRIDSSYAAITKSINDEVERNR